MALVDNIQDLDQSTFIDLFELKGFNPANKGELFRFTNHSGVVFDGKPYQPIPCQIDSLELTSDGPQPEPTLTLADTGGVITDLIRLYNNIEGAEIKIIRTQARYLDTGSTPDPTAILANAVFLIARRETHIPREAITFILANPIDIDGAKLPGRHCLRLCGWRYREDGCFYAGRGYTLNNEPTDDPSKDVCAHTLAACRVRFGRNAVLPYGGFPSLARRS